MSEIDILIAVNGNKLAQQVSDGSIQKGTASNPTSLGAWSSSDVYISMIAENSVAINEQGKSELKISAQSGDNLSWFMTTFGNNTDYTATLYKGSFSPSDAITVYGSSIQEENNYLPPAGNTEPTSATKYVNTFSTFAGKLIKVDTTITYYLSFVLVDNSTGDIVGYFKWDPFIQVA